jgi:predicted 2-oxoglutarate/Fe(II)-dependent dioxygenase YbiX
VDPRLRLAQLLGAQHGRGSFSARRTATPNDLHIDVTGVGALTMPVSAAKARQLIAVARPAQYGQGEQTLTDASVRHTWQVPKSRVRIDKRQWNRTLIPILDGLRGDLGLPAGSRLHAELHSFLVYSPGQFFLPHQDSEKSDDMVGTLTVTLPGASRGGELIVQHGEKYATYRSSDKLLSFVAFYADCRHEVQPVTSGYRIVLTYNLLLSVAGETLPRSIPLRSLNWRRVSRSTSPNIAVWFTCSITSTQRVGLAGLISKALMRSEFGRWMRRRGRAGVRSPWRSRTCTSRGVRPSPTRPMVGADTVTTTRKTTIPRRMNSTNCWTRRSA